MVEDRSRYTKLFADIKYTNYIQHTYVKFIMIVTPRIFRQLRIIHLFIDHTRMKISTSIVTYPTYTN